MAALTYNNATGNKGATGPQIIQGSEQGTSSSVGSEAGTTSKTTSGSSSQVQGINVSNMPAQAAEALQQLIAQLSDHPAVTEAAAINTLQQSGIKKPVQQWTTGVTGQRDGVPIQGGWEYRDELGRPTDAAGYQAALAKYQAELTKVVSSGGMIQGGTQDITRAQGQAQEEITALKGQREGYGKEDAFADASALQDRAMRQMLEAVMPSLNQAVESSGTSGGAVAGLLKQDAAARSAESAAALGLDAAVKYGQITNDINNTLKGLIESSPMATNFLLQALGVAKGSVEQGTRSTSGSSTATETGVSTSSKAVSGETSAKKEQVASKTDPLNSLLLNKQAALGQFAGTVF